MTQSLWSKGTFSSSSICLDTCTGEHLPPFQPDLVPSNSDASGVSVTLQNDTGGMKMLPDRQISSSGDTASGLLCFNQTNLKLSRESGVEHLSTRRHTSPAPYDHSDRNLNTGHQAKRARVESIIKGMTSTDMTANQHEETDYMQEDETDQEDAIRQKHMERSGSESTGENQGTTKQLDGQNRDLRQLRTKFSHADGGNESTNDSNEEKYPSWSDSSESSPGDEFTDSWNEFESNMDRKYQGWKTAKLPEQIKLMADVLKCELCRAVSRSIDSIFRSMPLLLTTHDTENLMTTVPLHSPESMENKSRFSCCSDVDIPDVQTEALSLVVQKPELERLTPTNHPKSPTPFSYSSALHEGQTPERNPSADYLRCLQDGCSEAGQSKFNIHWTSANIRTKVNSKFGSPRTRTVSMDPKLLERLRLPHMKIESDSLGKSNLYILNEGLTTNHLKKAKLMFFYTRYPSSLVLRMCFHDVQFTRCITSQLIKWFSNFREFYYIQMEKFARNALVEGVVDVRELTVGRESELFRALKVHFNKANDYQVPERFLQVAEITLREFYVAISTGKDGDPSWKKAIYRVICKLDSDVPNEFKMHHST